MPTPIPTTLRRLLPLCVATLAACSSIPCDPEVPIARPLASQLIANQLILLGEVHDNAEGHKQRLAALTAAVATGWKPAIAMEQFDREQQPALDAAMAKCADADCVIDAVVPDRKQWRWDFYKPVITLALREKLPLYAANLSRADAGKVMREGVSKAFDIQSSRAVGMDRGIPATLQAAQERGLEGSHCGMLPPQFVNGMARAQIARDAFMASVMLEARNATPGKPRPVVLLAGNGHVRRDIGVPQWLGHNASFVVGFLEIDNKAPVHGAGTHAQLSQEPYDRIDRVAVAERADPCIGMKPIK
ncbi:ChaN family lipoprotein [Pigmentiphaga aceris]|uniref:ChaN family lipoprotein n=1 Tax=Pigmentiphaga aceris TaxID=1940612 RepID=A0A5C0B290_9BURK|nr:ChaN family lipoprotein [Pigmentiphaga aceris]QEI06881.1 ChaN family lipoprotein [Pigmentiphaga aceris]